MGIKISLKKDRNPINTNVRICVECGSINTAINNKGVKCLDCGAGKKFKDQKKPIYKKGDKVRILYDGKDSERIYKIKKLKKSKDGNQLYLLKSDESKITLLYHEDEESHLEKVN